jgi:hypothetical protein
MNVKTKILLVLKGKRPLIDVWFYVQGNYRYWLYYSKYKWLLRRHIREQIKFRIQRMKPECYETGACVMCGCETTKLQMANKSCDGECYPPMLKAGSWKHFKEVFMEKQSGKLVYPEQNHHVKEYYVDRLCKVCLKSTLYTYREGIKCTSCGAVN